MNIHIALSRTKWEAKERECQSVVQLLRNKNNPSNIFYNTVSVVGIRETIKWVESSACHGHPTALGKVPPAPERGGAEAVLESRIPVRARE